MSAKHARQFVVTELVGQNAVSHYLPLHFKINPVVHAIHAAPFFAQPSDTVSFVVPRLALVPSVHGKEQVVDKILKHRRREKRYHFLTLVKSLLQHNAE